MNVPSLNSQYGKSSVLLGIFVLIALLVGIAAQQISQSPSKMPEFGNLIILPKPKAVGLVDFTDHNSQKFTEKNFEGKWSILFFAFTNCPDICPSTLQVLKQVKQDLVKANVWGAYQLAMVSVDPERDSPARLKQYVPFFDPEFIGLTAELSYTEQFAKNLGILFFKGDVLDNGGYDVDHGASLILINPNGQYAGVIGAPHKREHLTADLVKLGKYALNNQNIVTKSDSELANSKTIKQTITSSAPVNNLGLSISNAWIRPAPPQAPAMAGYFSIQNSSNEDITITGIESPLFGMSMIHETVLEDGVASMDHLSSLNIKAGETIKLEPMGTHLMLMRPKQDLSIGTQVPIQIELESGMTIDTLIEIRDNPAEQTSK